MAEPESPELSPPDAAALAQRTPTLVVDVREIHEYMSRHIEGSLLLPMSVFDPEDFPKLPGVAVLLVCATGKRSGAALKLLRDAGFDGPAYNLAGGIVAWAQAGLPVIEQPGEDFTI